MMNHLVQIEDTSDDPREFQQHAPGGEFADDEIPVNLLGTRDFKPAVLG